ncbi:hypothetical protein GCM10009850_011120 [Nonomuraea monospora]|uniref:WYL domain-containing protein n=1 Tax=Nonomuraea monospora TaxID=568818 RepID=A0ABN3C8K3_9ACTN
MVENLELKDRLLLEHPIGRPDGEAQPRFLSRLSQANRDFFGGVRIERFRADSAIRCADCGGRWPVFFQRSPKFTVTAVHGPRYYTTELRTTRETLDGGSTGTFRRKQIRESVAYTCELQVGRAETIATSTSAGLTAPAGPAALTARLDQRVSEEIRSHLKVTETKELAVEDTVEVHVPPGVVKELVIVYRQQWREHLFDLLFEDGVRVQVPVREADQLILDHRVRDL